MVNNHKEPVETSPIVHTTKPPSKATNRTLASDTRLPPKTKNSLESQTDRSVDPQEMVALIEAERQRAAHVNATIVVYSTAICAAENIFPHVVRWEKRCGRLPSSLRISVVKFLQVGSGPTPLTIPATPAVKVNAKKSTPATTCPPRPAPTTGHCSGEK